MANYWASYTTRKMISKKHRSSSSSSVKEKRKSIEDIVFNTLLAVGIAWAVIFGIVAVITGDVRFLAAIAASAGFAVVAPIAAMVVSDIMCRKKIAVSCRTNTAMSVHYWHGGLFFAFFIRKLC